MKPEGYVTNSLFSRYNEAKVTINQFFGENVLPPSGCTPVHLNLVVILHSNHELDYHTNLKGNGSSHSHFDAG